MSAREEIQFDLFELIAPPETRTRTITALTTEQLAEYEIFVVFMSGGKDSIAALLHLLEMGVPRDKIELHHHLVDGRESGHLMDWPVTESYCKALAAHLEIPIYMSWKEGGFEREMLRNEQATAPMWFETPEGRLGKSGGDSGKLGTRLKFPQVSASLNIRFCSSYLKISVGSAAITGQDRFHGKKTLVITGERAEESSSRAKYHTFEAHRSDARAGRLKRHVDHYRPVHSWPEANVWAIIQRWSIRPHPAYGAGWNRLSCALCIFGNSDQWASGRAALPQQFDVVKNYEAQFKVTIHRSMDVVTLGCCRFQRHFVKVVDETGDCKWQREGNSAGSSRLKQ